MRKLTIVLAASLIVVTGLLPGPALAGGHHHGAHAGVASHGAFVGRASPFFHGSTFARPFAFSRPPFFRPPFFRPFVPFVSSTVVVFSTPAFVVSGPVYDPPAPAVAYPAPAVAYPAPAVAVPPPPVPRVIEYPNGRYELHGDGVTSPYVWVWVPKPPPVPPPPPPPPDESSTPAPSSAPAPSPDANARSNATSRPRETASSTHQTELYCFADEQGVVTWTDRLAKIPERYRSRARRASDGAISGCRGQG